MQACHNKTRPPQYTLLFGNQNNNTIGYTEQMCTANTAFGVLSIEFNRIINLHSFLLGYDECWSMWCIHRSYDTRTTYVSSWYVYVCVCVFILAGHIQYCHYFWYQLKQTSNETEEKHQQNKYIGKKPNQMIKSTLLTSIT